MSSPIQTFQRADRNVALHYCHIAAILRTPFLKSKYVNQKLNLTKFLAFPSETPHYVSLHLPIRQNTAQDDN
jgi:hypothetical protein